MPQVPSARGYGGFTLGNIVANVTGRLGVGGGLGLGQPSGSQPTGDFVPIQRSDSDNNLWFGDTSSGGGGASSGSGGGDLGSGGGGGGGSDSSTQKPSSSGSSRRVCYCNFTILVACFCDYLTITREARREPPYP